MADGGPDSTEWPRPISASARQNPVSDRQNQSSANPQASSSEPSVSIMRWPMRSAMMLVGTSATNIVA